MATADVLTTFREDFTKNPDILELLNCDRKFEKQFCDVTLKAETKCFSVHRVVLGLMSKFFCKLFTTQMKEQFAAEINIKMTDEQLERLLNCIYTNDVQITNENALELHVDADYTQIEFLKSNCAKYILQMVGVDNCLEILAHAQRYHLTEIEERAKQVIHDNFEAVVQQDDFKQLDFDSMSAIINHQNTKKQGEFLFTGIIQWVHFKLSSRRENFVNLFSNLDLSTLSGEFLQTTVIDEILVRENVACCRSVMDTMKSFVLKPKLQGHQPQAQESTKILMVGGLDSEKQCVLIDVVTKQKEVLPQPILPVICATAVKFMNKVFIFGGYGENMTSCQMFDLNDRTWTVLADMPEGRWDAACAVLNDFRSMVQSPTTSSYRYIRVYDGRAAHQRKVQSCCRCTFSRYDQQCTQRHYRPGLQRACEGATGLIYVTGGRGNNNRRLSTCIIYDPDNNSWNKGLDLMQPRCDHAMVEFEGSLYVIGGLNGSSLNSCEKFSDNRWSAIQHMNEARQCLSVAVFQGNIYATCGSNGGVNYLTTVERYDPRSNSWTQVRPTNVGRWLHATCVLQGKLHVICGYEEKSVEVYDPQENKWTVCFHTDDFSNAGCIVAV